MITCGAAGCTGGLAVRIIGGSANGFTGADAATFRARAGTARDGLAVLRRLTLAAAFFTALRADLADFVDFFLVPAAVLADRPADFVDALLMAAL